MRDQRKYHIDGSLLINLQHQILTQLSELLSQLFSSLDDALFDLAENARDSHKQNQYFDVMHSMRLQKDQFCSQFKSGLTQQFRYLYNHRQAAPQEKFSDPGANDEANTIMNDALSEISAVMAHNFTDLSGQLTDRLNHYFNISSLTPENIPLGSAHFVGLFGHTLSKMNASQSLRLVLCEYFKRCVVNQLEPILFDANQLLSRQGILPTLSIDQRPLRDQAINDHLPRRTAINEDLQLYDPADLPTLKFEQLQKIVARNFERSLNYRLFAAKPQQPGPELETDSIVNLLGKLRDAHIQSLLEEPSHEHHSHYEPHDLRLLIEYQIVYVVRQSGRRKLNQDDDDAISMVASVFELLHNDPNYPVEMTHLLSQLQLPIMQTVLMDKTFFCNAKHPIRRLIKLLSLAAVSWERPAPGSRDLLLEEVTSIITNFVQSYNPLAYEAVANLEKDFQKFIIMETKRARMVEQQMQEPHQDQAPQVHNTTLIKQLIQDRTQGKTLPVSILYMIKGPFSSLLTKQLEEDDVHSAEWQSSLKLLDDLLWSIQPNHYLADQDRWLSLSKQVHVELEKRLCASDIGQEKAKELSSMYADIVAHIKDSKGLAEPANCVKVDHTAADPKMQQRFNLPPGSAAERQRERSKRFRQWHNTLNIDPNSERLRQSITDLKLGQWIELIMPDGKIRRCRLSSRETNTLSFVARDGRKVLTTGIDELLQKLQSNQVSLLESNSFWDRSIKQLFHDFTTRSQLETVV